MIYQGERATALYHKLVELTKDGGHNCNGSPESWVDFELGSFGSFEEEVAEFELAAPILCYGCPLMVDCDRYARTVVADNGPGSLYGIWGGRFYS